MRGRPTTTRRGGAAAGTRAARPGARWWVLALCSAALAVAAHGLAGGDLPGSVPVVLLTVLITCAGMAVAQRLPGITAVLVVLGMTQLCAHLLLSDGGHGTPDQPDQGAPVLHPVPMVITHVVATMLTAVLLRGAGRAATRVASAVRLLCGLLAVVVTGPSHLEVVDRLPVLQVRSGHLIEVVLRRIRCRRGPPVCS